MKLIGRKLLGIVFIATILFAGLTSRAYGYRISTQSDSINVTTATGTSTSAWIAVFDGRDTLPNLSKGTIHVSFTSSSSELTMVSDSVIQFVGITWIQINYAPTGSARCSGTLTITSDSNTVTVGVQGIPIHHFPVTVDVWGLDSLPLGDYCPSGTNVGVYNQNPDTIYITKIELVDDPAPGTQFHFKSTPDVPTWVPGHASYGMWWLCVNTSADSVDYSGSITIIYTYHGVTDSATVFIHAHRKPLNTTCLTASSGDFGSVTEGSSEMKSITLTNVTRSAIHLDSAELSGATFSLTSGSFPLTIPSGSSKSVNVTFSMPSPHPDYHYSGTLTIWVRGTSPDSLQCSNAVIPLSGDLLIPIVDTITLDVPPDSASLTITAHVTKTRHVILIHNTGSNKLLLNSLSVSMSDTTVNAFFGTGGQTAYLYDSLVSGGTSGPIYLTLDAQDTGTYTLNLTLTYTVMKAHSRNEITSENTYHYTVIAHRLPNLAAAVTPQPAIVTADFSISPNPTHGFVTIQLPEGIPSQIEIFDVLGNRVFQTQATDEFRWNGETLEAAGSYIVKVTVRRSDGTISTASKRLVILR